MSTDNHVLHTAIVRRAAAGLGSNPDTFMLVEKPDILLKTGLRLRLLTRESRTYTHIGWARIERVRVVERNEVEYVLRRLSREADLLDGEHHFLIVGRSWTVESQPLRRTVGRVVSALKQIGKKNAPIQRFLPPTPPSSSSSLSILSMARQLSSIAINSRATPNSTECESVSSVPEISIHEATRESEGLVPVGEISGDL
ncbi:hypothetical protein K466DRAFT_607632 [Polyporus arcularius HHB13444]|uniref:Uncharacterized protein n=1 Tax=Polyporus arcularius HHB13444 TaxID=1314778 RepID=A0A5C3NJC3_9APHY|nr:hypothetical protein K466DRAFT_607632 [Polyporus arcularius HHB13444]